MKKIILLLSAFLILQSFAQPSRFNLMGWNLDTVVPKTHKPTHIFNLFGNFSGMFEVVAVSKMPPKSVVKGLYPTMSNRDKIAELIVTLKDMDTGELVHYQVDRANKNVSIDECQKYIGYVVVLGKNIKTGDLFFCNFSDVTEKIFYDSKVHLNDIPSGWINKPKTDERKPSSKDTKRQNY